MCKQELDLVDFGLKCDTLFFCSMCNEEYHLPQEIDGCPICLSEDLKAVS